MGAGVAATGAVVVVGSGVDLLQAASALAARINAENWSVFISSSFVVRDRGLDGLNVS